MLRNSRYLHNLYKRITLLPYPMDPSAVRASSAEWNEGVNGISAGNLTHAALDEYNNTGMLNGIAYAPDADAVL